ncbi:NUDIX hydrolase [Brevundimonas sp. PAMC22021]|uniref:NUDIX domain-containing protein n=1 Tax=Brevundimonas sp. PAMC22021 TaxID=2861285 RepID=UPI001C638B79|nr:NUDIX hydrolase [Brevundimonas sp. PAMC22021]QYF86227.1 NUDIX hydrolase [Brevundimonas sp. PAMC22021]
MARIVGSEQIHSGWSRLHMATIQTDEGARIVREVEDHGNGAAVLPYDPERRVALLARQLRPGPLFAGAANPLLLEAPAGLIDPGETPADSVRREALEEVGVRLERVDQVAAAFSCPGVSTERLFLFLGEYRAIDRIGAGGGLAGEHEAIEVVEVSLSELARMADGCEIEDLKTLHLVLCLRLRQPDLFG